MDRTAHSRLDFVAIWHDADMIEPCVVAANDSFSGATEAYSSREDLLSLADFVALYLFAPVDRRPLPDPRRSFLGLSEASLSELREKNGFIDE